MLCKVQRFPKCEFHVFLSHCAEDRDSLVFPLDAALRQQHVIPWLDQHHYEYGAPVFEALRSSMLKCRHTVFLITKAMLTQPRGWGILELAWAEVLQENLRDYGLHPEPGEILQVVSLPLFLAERTSDLLWRSPWAALHDRGPFYRAADGDPIAWALGHICQFVRRRAAEGRRIAEWLEEDSRANKRLGKRAGLLERITCQHPAPMAHP